jgi:transglutaminase/protease-like cytokinesis protein 3
MLFMTKKEREESKKAKDLARVRREKAIFNAKNAYFLRTRHGANYRKSIGVLETLENGFRWKDGVDGFTVILQDNGAVNLSETKRANIAVKPSTILRAKASIRERIADYLK